MVIRFEMAETKAIQQLVKVGWSHRKIAKEFGNDHGSVAKYSKPANVHTGSLPEGQGARPLLPSELRGGNSQKSSRIRTPFLIEHTRNSRAERLWFWMRELGWGGPDLSRCYVIKLRTSPTVPPFNRIGDNHDAHFKLGCL